MENENNTNNSVNTDTIDFMDMAKLNIEEPIDILDNIPTTEEVKKEEPLVSISETVFPEEQAIVKEEPIVEEQIETKKFCNNCGAEITGNFCGQCGTRVEN